MPTLTSLNGLIPLANLTAITATYRLRADAAAAYNRMRNAGCPAGVTSAYRTREQQRALYALYRAGRGNLAAPPGTSFHGEGTALDLPEPARSWVSAHGAAYGWISGRVKGEPWHKEYDPARDRHRPAAAPPPPAAARRSATVSKATQRAVRVSPDGFWGDGTDRGVNLVRAALNGQFPEGVAATQRVVGAHPDGDWGGRSRAALVATVKALQRAWGTGPDGAWGTGTEAAWVRARTANYRTW